MTVDVISVQYLLVTYRETSVTYLSNVAIGSDSQSSYYVFADISFTILIW